MYKAIVHKKPKLYSQIPQTVCTTEHTLRPCFSFDTRSTDTKICIYSVCAQSAGCLLHGNIARFERILIIRGSTENIAVEKQRRFLYPIIIDILCDFLGWLQSYGCGVILCFDSNGFLPEWKNDRVRFAFFDFILIFFNLIELVTWYMDMCWYWKMNMTAHTNHRKWQKIVRNYFRCLTIQQFINNFAEWNLATMLTKDSDYRLRPRLEYKKIRSQCTQKQEQKYVPIKKPNVRWITQNKLDRFFVGKKTLIQKRRCHWSALIQLRLLAGMFWNNYAALAWVSVEFRRCRVCGVVELLNFVEFIPFVNKILETKVSIMLVIISANKLLSTF